MFYSEERVCLTEWRNEKGFLAIVFEKVKMAIGLVAKRPVNSVVELGNFQNNKHLKRRGHINDLG
jgi:hypothetical protein